MFLKILFIMHIMHIQLLLNNIYYQLNFKALNLSIFNTTEKNRNFLYFFYLINNLLLIVCYRNISLLLLLYVFV